MDYYSQGNVPPAMGKSATTGMTVDKACKLLRSTQPMVWAFSIVFGLLSVTLIVRYLWTRKRMDKKQTPETYVPQPYFITSDPRNRQ